MQMIKKMWLFFMVENVIWLMLIGFLIGEDGEFGEKG
jgi:hypothetical protein